jgi:hypothetical protein
MKLLPTVCAVALCASFISVRADDTPVQAAARAALEQKMSEIDTNQTQPPPVVVTPAGAAKAPTKPARNQNSPRQGNNSGGCDSGGRGPGCGRTANCAGRDHTGHAGASDKCARDSGSGTRNPRTNPGARHD